jgi:hypothetical protein
MKYVGPLDKDWQLWLCDDGTYEGWRTKNPELDKKTGAKSGKGLDRIVLLAKEEESAMDELRLRTSQRPRIKEVENPNQLRIE